MAIPFLGGGEWEGRGGVSEEVETLGEALPLKLLTTKDSQKLYDAVFLFRDPPSPGFWIRPC